MRSEQILDFDCVVDGEGDKAVVLLHGYGASKEDLAPLAGYLSPDDETCFIFPNAPLEVPLGFMMSGRAWFPIDEQALNEAMARGEFRDFAQVRPAGMDEAVEQVLGFVESLQDDFQQVIIGGFSQGAMTSTEVAAKLEKKPDGLIVWSGALVDESQWNQWLSSCEGLPVIQSHGSQDPLLSFKEAERLGKMFQDHGLQSKFLGFRGAHEIPMPVVDQTKNFIQSCFGSDD